MEEREVVRYPQMRDLSIFLDTVDYRTPHFHRELELVWVLEGALRVTRQRAQLTAAPGDIVLFSPGQSHEFHKMGQSCTFLCLQVAAPFFERAFPGADGLVFEPGTAAQCFGPEEYRCLQEQLAALAMCYFERAPGYELCCTGRMHLLLHALLTHVPHHILTPEQQAERARRSGRLERLLRFVDEGYTQKIRLSDFAQREGCSMSYMSHFVRENLSQTFQDYVNTVRFHCACKRIDTGHERLMDICVASGFSDYRYFCAAFRRRLGMTPEEYRLRRTPAPGDAAATHRSVHSLERFYTRERSLVLLPALWERLRRGC